MAKRLLVNVLLDVFGDYVEGLTEENLQIGVWSGKLSLHNLALNRDTFQKLALPVSIHHGTVRDFEVTIPWTSLESQPVKVEINGVYLQCGPLSTETLDPVEIERKLFEAKQQKLDQLERRLDEQKQIDEMQEKQADQGPGWVQRLTTTIIDNLIVTVRNIHVRYEDSTTYPGMTFAAGLTLDSFLVRSTDADWRETFIVRDKKQQQASIRKSATLSNLAMYWNPTSEDMQHMEFEPWLQRMSMLIYSGQRTDPNMHFLLRPVSMQLKAIHNEQVSGDRPKFDITLDSGEIAAELSTTQFEQLLQTQESLAKLERFQKFFPFRPKLRPTQDPRAWWQYAYKFVTNKPPSQLKPGLAGAVQIARLRKEYIPLFKRSKNLEWLPALLELEKIRLRDIEVILPIETLLLFRKVAKKEIYDEEKARGMHEPKKQGFFSRLWSGNKKPTPEPDEVSIEDLQAQAARVAASDEAHPHLFSLHLAASAGLVLKAATQPIVEASMGMHLAVDQRSGLDIKYTVDTMVVKDLFSRSAVYPELIAVRLATSAEQENQPLLDVTVHAAEQTHVDVKALPLEIVLNQPCLQQLMGFTKGVTIDTTQIAQVIAANVSEEDIKKALGSTTISVDVAAPKIIVPQDYSVDGGVLLLDCGNIRVDGALGIGNTGAMRWDVTIAQMQAAMPNSRQEIYALDAMSYLIRPFDIVVNVQTVDTQDADMTVRCRIEPELRGVLDAPKLERLLSVVDVVVATFTTDAPEVEDPLANIMHQQIRSAPGVDLAAMTEVSSLPAPEVQPGRKQVDVQAVISAIALELQYDPETLSSLRLAVVSLETSIGVRPYDTMMQFSLAQLVVEDSQRHDSQKRLASSPQEDKLLQIGFNTISSRKSPLYDRYATVLDVNFKTLQLNIDARTIGHLEPFFTVLLTHGAANQPSPDEVAAKAALEEAKAEEAEAVGRRSHVVALPSTQAATAPSGGVKGMKVRAEIGSICLEMFDRPLFDQANIELNSMLTVKIVGLLSEVEMLERTHAAVKLQTFEVMDTRRSSERHAYRHLVAPRQAEPSAQETAAEEVPPLLSVDYREDEGGLAFVKLNLDGFLSYISLDALMVAINVSLDNTNAVLALLTPPSAPPPPPPDALERRSSIVSLPGTAAPQPAQQSILHVDVTVANPRIILLEDPASASSRALVACATFRVGFTQDMLGTSGKQKITVSVQGLESFVLEDIQNWSPMQIIQPLVIDALLENVIELGDTVGTSVSVEADDLEARVSVTDVLLVLDILERAMLIESGPAASTSPATTAETASSQSESDVVETAVTPTKYTVVFSWGKIRITGINDFDGQAIPVIAVNLQTIEFHMSGPLTNIRGMGSFTVWSDFFNPELAVWEPLLENWSPMLEITTEGDRMEAVIDARNHLQLNVTGICVRTMTSTLATFIQVTERTQHTREHAPFLIKNETGYDFVLNNSTSGEPMAAVHAGEDVWMNPNNRTTREYGVQKLLFDLAPAGALAQERQPIRRLQASRTNERILTLQPLFGGDALQYSHPVVEEVYELQRYDPFRRTWKNPFLPTDPPHWTDVSLTRKRPRNEITPPARWTWQDDWHVDMSGRVGVDIDEEGWDYAVDFSGLDRKKKGKQSSLDCARRRRWLRTRAPTPPDLDDPARPLSVVWDVQSLESGRKIIRIRSPVQVQNNLPFPVVVVLSHPTWNEQFEFGPVLPEALFSIPVKYAYATGMQLRHADIPSEPTEVFSTVPSATDSKVNHPGVISAGAAGRMQFVVQRTVRGRQLFFLLEPLGVMANWLPCTLHVRFRYGETKQQRATEEEEVALVPGQKFKVVRGNVREAVSMSFRVGSFDWSPFVPFRDPEKRHKRRDIGFSSGGDSTNLALSLKNHVIEDTGAVDCVVFSKFALVDRTGLELAIKGKSPASNGNVVRNSFSRTAESEEKSADPIARLDNLALEFKAEIPNAPMGYELYAPQTRTPVYSDRAFTWTYLPEEFTGGCMLRTMMNDKHRSTDDLLTVAVNKACMVFVLMDIDAKKLPNWMIEDGYRAVPLNAIARRGGDPTGAEIVYRTFMKVQAGAGQIRFGGNRCQSMESYQMYAAFVKGIEDVQQVRNIWQTAASPLHEGEETGIWADGGRGMTLFSAQGREASIGVLRGRSWSEKVPLPATDVHTPAVFSVEHSGMEYMLCYKLERMPGPFGRTQRLTVMPRFCVVNLMDEVVKVRAAKGTSTVEVINPFDTIPWHRQSEANDISIVFQCEDTEWSPAGVDISEVGSYELLLPSSKPTPKVLHVEVKVAEPTEDCAVTVLIWESVVEAAPLYRITNETPMPVTVRERLPGDREGIAFTVGPHQSAPFGWLDLESHGVEVVAGTTFSSVSSNQSVRLNFEKPGRVATMASSQGELYVGVLPIGSSKVLRVTTRMQDLQTSLTPEQRLQKLSDKSTKLRLALNSIGISVVAEKPSRREILTCSISGVSVEYTMTSVETNAELKIQTLQIDNHIRETRVYPALLAVAPQKKSHDSDPDQPLLHATVVQRVVKGTATPVYDYVAFRMLELLLQVDWGSIEVIFNDFLTEIQFSSKDETHSRRNPAKWVKQLTSHVAASEGRDFVDIKQAKIVAQASRYYFDHIIIHPMKVTLSFVNTSTGTSGDEDTGVMSALGGTVMTFIKNMATVDRSPIRTSSFETHNVLDPPAKIAMLMVLHNKVFVMAQLASIAGSLAIIGSPATLLRNVGSGVTDFVYEPYQGLVESPMGFVKGIGRGSHSLVAGVVTSALNSAAGIIASASSGIALISGDTEFARQRQLERQRQAASRHGAVEGLKEGATSIATGIASGITGLFTTPVKEAKKEGAVGFMKGVGKGILGVAVKPVLGVTDGVTAMVQGVSNTLGNVQATQQVRPPRPLTWQLDVNNHVLRLLDLRECEMFAFMLQEAENKKRNERYMISTRMEHGQVLISNKCIRLIVNGEQKPWTKLWENIEYAEVTEQTIRLHFEEGKTKNISFADPKTCALIYGYLAHHSHKMSRPGDMIPPEQVGELTGEESEAAKQFNALAIVGGYKFGTANKERAARKKFRDDDQILAFAQSSFLEPWDSGDWANLDRRVWGLVNDWDKVHSGLQACRCCAVLIVNKANVSVHISRVELVDGLDFRILVGTNYDTDARSVLPGGWVVVFGWAFSPSPVRLGHLKMHIHTTGFVAEVGSKRKWVSIHSTDQVDSTFNEKSLSDWWSKFTIVLSPKRQV